MTNDQIKETKAFKELDAVTKLVYQKKEMMARVKSEFGIAKKLGLEKYEKMYFPRPYLLKVITELLDQY